MNRIGKEMVRIRLLRSQNNSNWKECNVRTSMEFLLVLKYYGCTSEVILQRDRKCQEWQFQAAMDTMYHKMRICEVLARLSELSSFLSGFVEAIITRDR